MNIVVIIALIASLLINIALTIHTVYIYIYTKHNKEADNSLITSLRKVDNTNKKWIKNLISNKRLEDYLYSNDIVNIGIFGMGSLGELLFSELESSKNIEIRCIIDSMVDGTYYTKNNVMVIGINDIEMLNQLDTIIVTPIQEYDVISVQLHNNNVRCKIISLDQLILETEKY